MNSEQLEIIQAIFTKAEEQNIPLWLDGGWAIDAKLGKITREHGDIDIGFPEDRRADYQEILDELGFIQTEEFDYGFLSKKGDVLLDSEICKKVDGGYTMESFPRNTCPNEKNGQLEGLKVRCISWDKMYVEFLYLAKEVKKDDWEPKHHASLEIIQEHLSPARRKELEDGFRLGRLSDI